MTLAKRLFEIKSIDAPVPIILGDAAIALRRKAGDRPLLVKENQTKLRKSHSKKKR